jgi:hemoglobin
MAGGPPLYTDKYGHPRLRMRHFVAPIGKAEIEGWLACFHIAWAEIIPPSPLADTISRKSTHWAGTWKTSPQWTPNRVP